MLFLRISDPTAQISLEGAARAFSQASQLTFDDLLV